MKVETSNKSINVNRIVSKKKESFILEEDMIIPDIKPDILKAISENGNVCIYKREAQDGKVRLEGNVNIYLIYLADSEKDNIRGLNTNIDFKQVFENNEALSQMDVKENVTIKSIECKVLNGRKVSLTVELEAEITLYQNEEINIITDINNITDLQKIDRVIKINSTVGSNSIKTYAKETLKIDSGDNLAEILRVDLNIINKDTKVSYNKILAKADANVKLMYLTEDNRIRNIEEKIPVMGFIEMNNISEEDICDTRYVIRNIIIKPNSEEEHSVYVEIELEISCNAFKEEEINMVEDLYSPSRELEYNTKNIMTMVGKKTKNDVCEIREKVQIPELAGEKIYDVKATPVINNTKISNGKIMFDGEMKVEFMISANNGTTVESVTKNIPLLFNMEFEDITENSKIETNMDIIMQDCVIEDSEASLNINLNFEVNKYNQLNLNIIQEVTECEEKKECNPYSMTIYFVKQGDTLWKIAKKFKSTVDDIVKLNEIADPDKIDIGMQLFIPKYVCTMKASE